MLVGNGAFIAKIRISFGSFSHTIDNPILWGSIAIVVLFFLYHWGIKKFFIFSFVLSGSIYLMFQADQYIVDIFGKEEGEFYTLLTKPFFAFIIGFVFIYYTFIDRE